MTARMRDATPGLREVPSLIANVQLRQEPHRTRSAGGGFDDARRLGGNGSLEGDEREERGLDELSFRQRRRHLEERFVSEHRRAFLDGLHVASEPEPGQVGVEERGGHAAEHGQAAQILDLVGFELQMLEVVERLLETCAHQECAMIGQRADIQLEGGAVIHPAGVVAGQHRQLVQVCEESAHGRLRAQDSGLRARLAPGLSRTGHEP